MFTMFTDAIKKITTRQVDTTTVVSKGLGGADIFISHGETVGGEMVHILFFLRVCISSLNNINSC